MMTPQDFERLSAYLDNQLSTAEKANLEKRLAQEPELKAALADLRMAVRALRALRNLRLVGSFQRTCCLAGLPTSKNLRATRSRASTCRTASLTGAPARPRSGSERRWSG